MKLSSWFAYAKSQRCWPSLHSLCLAREATEGERMIMMKLRLQWLVQKLVYVYIYVYIYLFIYVIIIDNWSYVFLCLLERSSDMGHGPFSNFTPIFSHPQSWAMANIPWFTGVNWCEPSEFYGFMGGIPMVISCVPEKKLAIEYPWFLVLITNSMVHRGNTLR